MVRLSFRHSLLVADLLHICPWGRHIWRFPASFTVAVPSQLWDRYCFTLLPSFSEDHNDLSNDDSYPESLRGGRKRARGVASRSETGKKIIGLQEKKAIAKKAAAKKH